MLVVSEAPVEAPKARKYDSYNPDTYKTDEQKKEEVRFLCISFWKICIKLPVIYIYCWWPWHCQPADWEKFLKVRSLKEEKIQ